jgi:tight adherence protein B
MKLLGRRSGAPPPIDAVAAVTQRLAVLLSAGVAPASAWTYLLPVYGAEATDAPARPTESDRPFRASRASRSERAGPSGAVPRDPTDAIVHAAATAGAAGENIADAISAAAHDRPTSERQAWLALAAAWSVATAAGAPLAASLRELAASFRQIGQLQRDVGVALAGPSATAHIVLALPAVGLAFGALMGFDTLHALFATLPGLLCLAVGIGLIAAGARWNAHLVRRAQATDAAAGLALDLTAVGMAGGASVARARELVTAALDRYPVPSGDAEGAITAVLELAVRAGVPAAELLRSEADQVRRAARSDGQRKAETLAVTLMLPLGLCVLPAFMLVGVAPLLLGVLASTFGVL